MGVMTAATEKELQARHAREKEELEEKGRAHVDAVPAGKGKVAKVETAKREVEQWIYEMSQRHDEEVEGLADGNGDAAPPEVAAPKAELSGAQKRAAAKEEAEKAAAEEAAKAKIKNEKKQMKM